MDFDSILRKSLTVVNDGFQDALTDLKGVVEAVSESVKNNAGQKFALALGEVSNDLRGSTFRVFFDTDVNNVRARIIDVLYFRIPASGYPIFEGQYDKGSKNFSAGKELKDKDSIAQEFGSLLRNPDSSLIQAIGYAMRTKDDDDIPF
ncbi:hypothetical protein [Janthinobacterium sp. BJB446]|uniref:hypothetical protein n=1 Tax=Janthinobacterium sp. BJB446 TaxID=2048009 RepID=UPI00117AA7F0|nr:hypothetical protein [Janthinobacterium sp. BJB446]